jgi:hypothetical protein
MRLDAVDWPAASRTLAIEGNVVMHHLLSRELAFAFSSDHPSKGSTGVCRVNLRHGASRRVAQKVVFHDGE